MTRGISWNEAFWTWALPLCSGDGVSLGNSDRNTPTSSRALVTTGSLALKSLLKPCNNTHIHKHKTLRIIVVRFNMSFAMVPYCSVNVLLTLTIIQYNTFLSSLVNLICYEEQTRSSSFVVQSIIPLYALHQMPYRKIS